MISGEQLTAGEAGRITIGMMAPDFEAITTHGRLKLSDLKGNWVILFSHPADFTPVCTTEFVEFSRKHEEFKKRGVKLLGLSVDGLASHIAWVRDIEEHMGVHISFPIIADLDTKVAHLYGMIHHQVSHIMPVRSVFIIDPKMIVRMIIFYPTGVGRNIDELLRTLDALQVVEKHKVDTPANWQPGDPVLIEPPHTQQGAEDRIKEGYECTTWYLCKKKI